MGFWKYLKKEEPRKEYEQSKHRIMELHQTKHAFSYIREMYCLKNGEGELSAEFVHGMHQNGETAVLYDCYGKESGRIVIKELLIGQDENKGKFSESGQTGKIIFQYEEVQSEQFWKSQYVISGKKQDDLPKK